jgi:hypothetical protein
MERDLDYYIILLVKIVIYGSVNVTLNTKANKKMNLLHGKNSTYTLVSLIMIKYRLFILFIY